MTSTRAPQSASTAAFYLQAAVSFALAMGGIAAALVLMGGEPWVRAFLGAATLWLVSSTFTLAKCVRDREESASVLSRVDQARLEKMLAEHDPFRAV